MTPEIENLAGILADEESGAAAKAIADRIATIENRPTARCAPAFAPLRT